MQFVSYLLYSTGGFTRESFTISFTFSIILPGLVLITGNYLEEESGNRGQSSHDTRIDEEEDTLLTSISEDTDKLLKEIYNYNQYILINKSFSKIESRIKSEIDSLSKQSRLNLIIGLITSIIGISILSTSLFFNTSGEQSWLRFTQQFVPRASVAILIEIFSFYFLTIYKRNLQEIKFYQNELTSIEMKLFSYQSLYFINDPDSLKRATEQLLNLERNIILRDGELSLDLEKEKINSKLDASFIDKLDFLKEQIIKSGK